MVKLNISFNPSVDFTTINSMFLDFGGMPLSATRKRNLIAKLADSLDNLVTQFDAETTRAGDATPDTPEAIPDYSGILSNRVSVINPESGANIQIDAQRTVEGDKEDSKKQSAKKKSAKK